MSPGRLLIITGTTGSGKTTTCKEFVAGAEELWLHFGADQFLGGVVPRKFVDGGARSTEVLHKVLDDPMDPGGSRHLELGPYGLQAISTLHAMVAAAVRNGSNVVMDHIATVDPPILQSCLQHFRGLPVDLVALKPPLAVIPERLDQRLDEIVGALSREQTNIANQNTKRMAEFLYQQIFAHDDFDLVIDSAACTPPEVAGLIAEHLRSHRRQALDSLVRKLDDGRPPFAS